MAHIDSFRRGDEPGQDEMTRPHDDDFPPRFLSKRQADSFGGFEDQREDEATRLSNLESIAAMERARANGSGNEDRTRAVNIRNDPSISDIDWDLD
jgi:hypothetical protein